MPEALTAPLMAVAPNLVADTEDNLPLKLPIGVLTAATIYTSFIVELEFRAKVRISAPQDVKLSLRFQHKNSRSLVARK